MTPDAQNEQSGVSQVLEIPADYNPASLRHLGLRVPRPSDLPSDVQDQAFTFDDAFEDLLSAHFDGHVLPIRQLAAQSAALRIMYPQGEPLSQQLPRLSGQYRIPIAERQKSLFFFDRPLLQHFSRNPNSLEAVVFALTNLESFAWVAGESNSRVANLDSLWGRATAHGQKQDDEEPHQMSFTETFGVKYPQTELDHVEAQSKNSNPSASPWLSPFDTLWSAITGKPHRGGSFASTTHDVVSTVEGGIVTEHETRTYTDEQGRRIEWSSERRIDAKTGNVISEKSKRLIDGKEADPYDDSF